MWQLITKYIKWSNIKKGWKTTVIGSIIVIAAITSVFVVETTWTEASIGIMIGLGLLGVADKVKEKEEN